MRGRTSARRRRREQGRAAARTPAVRRDDARFRLGAPQRARGRARASGATTTSRRSGRARAGKGGTATLGLGRSATRRAAAATAATRTGARTAPTSTRRRAATTPSSATSTTASRRGFDREKTPKPKPGKPPPAAPPRGHDAHHALARSRVLGAASAAAPPTAREHAALCAGRRAPRRDARAAALAGGRRRRRRSRRRSRRGVCPSPLSGAILRSRRRPLPPRSSDAPRAQDHRADGGDTGAYEPKRVPSWTDRVLWRSMPAHAGGCGSSSTSAARLSARPTTSPCARRSRSGSPPPPPPRACLARLRWPPARAHAMLAAPDLGPSAAPWLRRRGARADARALTRLAAQGLTAMDWAIDGGKSDPYVGSPPSRPAARGSARAPATSACRRRSARAGAHERPQEHARPALAGRRGDHARAPAARPRLHRGLHCALVCVDYDVHSADDVIGSCALPLGRWLLDAGAPLAGKGSGAWHEFDEVLLHNGREHGRLRGAVEIVPSVFGGTSK